MAKGQNKETLYRVVKFQIFPTEAEIEALKNVSDNLRAVWNEALNERQLAFDRHVSPIYQQIKELKDSRQQKTLQGKLPQAYKQARVTLFDQINALTLKRRNNDASRVVPRNWQEETLDTLEGSFKSFVSLRKKGDPNARPPRERREQCFMEIPGRTGFKLIETSEGLACKLSLRKIAPSLDFTYPIPAYQQEKLADAKRVKKFTLFRTTEKVSGKDRYWISLAYEINKPEPEEFDPDGAVFIALGASSIGVSSAKGDFYVKLRRPDLYWKPKIEAVATRMDNVYLKKGSKRWRRRKAAHARMNQLMARQKKQYVREVVSYLLKLNQFGRHFVVTDMVIRSKKGRLADGTKPERGGSPTGLNWSAQNTGSIASLVAQLQVKAPEYGGTVTKFPLQLNLNEIPVARGYENKVEMARLLREKFIQKYEKDKKEED